MSGDRFEFGLTEGGIYDRLQYRREHGDEVGKVAENARMRECIRFEGHSAEKGDHEGRMMIVSGRGDDLLVP